MLDDENYVMGIDAADAETYDGSDATMLVKENIATDAFLRLVLKYHNKNRNWLTHAFVVYPLHGEPFILTDAVIVPKPTVESRVNAVIAVAEFFKVCFSILPQVNFLTPNGHVSDKVPESLDAQKCIEMLGNIRPDLPKATAYQLDAALDPESAKIKYGIETRRANIISASSLAEGNAIVKSFLLNGAKVFGYVIGADIPVVLNSRANLRDNADAVNWYFDNIEKTED